MTKIANVLKLLISTGCLNPAGTIKAPAPNVEYCGKAIKSFQEAIEATDRLRETVENMGGSK